MSGILVIRHFSELIYRYRQATKLDPEFEENDAEKFAELAETELRQHLQGTESRIKSAQDLFRKSSQTRVEELHRDTTPRRRTVSRPFHMYSVISSYFVGW